MNWQHLQAFLWLRWRMMINQWRRAGALNAVLMTIFAVCAVALAVPLFIACFVAGLYGFPKAQPQHLLYVWDGIVLAFAFCWGLGLLVELQRTESLSMSKFLHLPVSVNGVFLINYVSSLVSFTLLGFGPILCGLSLALVFSRGWQMLPALPLTAAFVLMLTALTYQFQGWLATLMNNPRRRRTVVVMATIVFILIFQLPNLWNMATVGRGFGRLGRLHEKQQELTELARALETHEIDAQEYARRSEELMGEVQRAGKAFPEVPQSLNGPLRVANLILPIGWLPLGIVTAAEGRLLPALLGCVGMSAIGAASLWRAYRTTVGLYQGQFSAGAAKRVTAPRAAPKTREGQRGSLLVERQIRGVSEPVAAIALASFRSLLRAPEAKMVLLGPLLMGGGFGFFAVLNANASWPELARPLLPIGGMTIVLFSMLQLMSNQFGFDRDGFRIYVLCAVPRREILLGKNLACAPLGLGMAFVMLVVLQVLCPLRLDHFLAMPLQFVTMFALFCPVANLASIYSPMPIAIGSLKPAKPKLLAVLGQFLIVMFCLPLAQVPTLIPLGVEAFSQLNGWTSRAPICLVLSIAECAIAILVYRLLLTWQGRQLQEREQKILETVTNRA